METSVLNTLLPTARPLAKFSIGITGIKRILKTLRPLLLFVPHIRDSVKHDLSH